MIGKALRSAGSTRGLVAYLFSESAEHSDPRVIASWDATLQESSPRRLAALLDAPAAQLPADAKGVYHLILSSGRENNGQPADKPLTDREWAGIAKDAVRRVGLTGNGGPGDDARWIAVRHDQAGAEHVHIVATLATENGRRLWARNDHYRIGEACRHAEDLLGLRTTRPRDRTSTPPPTRAETDRARRTGVEPTREQLRRQVREAVGRSTSKGSDGTTLMFGGGKLASDLTLPKVQARYGEVTSSRPSGVREPRSRPTAEQRAAMWAQNRQAVERAAAALRQHDRDPQAAAGAAWAASDYLAGAARLVDGRNPGALSRAARDLDLAAREPYGRTPPPSRAGAGLRAAGGLLLAARVVQHDETAQLLALLAQAAALADALTRLRESQGREVQAAAARRAAEGLRKQYTDRNTAGQVAAAVAASWHVTTTQEEAWSSTRTR